MTLPLTYVNCSLATASSPSRLVQAEGCLDVLPPRPGDKLQSLCDNGQIDRALSLLVLMDKQGTVPSLRMYKSLLRACAKRKSLAAAKRVQCHIARHRLDTSRLLGEYIVMTMIKCGGDEDAVQAFERLPDRTVVSWSAIILACNRAGEARKALRFYERMQEEFVTPNAYTFVSVLQACGSLADLGVAKRIHSDILKYRCETDLYVRTCLVDTYGKCGSIVDAQQAFDGLSERDVVAWTAMLAACVQHGQAGQALELYKQMRQEGVHPNNRTLVSVLQACGMAADREAVLDGYTVKVTSLELGRTIHADVEREGYSSDVYVGNTLISMYGKCGSIVDAQNVFDGLLQRGAVTWTAMLGAYVEQGQAEKVLQLYDLMQEEGVSPDARTFVTTLQACGMCAELEEDITVKGRSMRPLEKGMEIHLDAHKRGYDADVFVGSTLVSMYGKCGSLSDAENVFRGLSHQNVVSFNAMLAAFVQQGQAESAVRLYESMLEVGMTPNDRTFVSVIQACGILAEKERDEVFDRNGGAINVNYLEMGKVLHADVWKKTFHALGFVGNALVSMYGKCGSILDAFNLFTALPHWDVVLWNAMLGAYAQHSQPKEALHLYGRMQEEGVSPNKRTFVSTLQACAALVESAQDYDSGIGRYTNLSFLDKIRAIHANAQRKGCASDKYVGSTLMSVYGKCGSIVDAENVFEGLPERDSLVWTTMLAVYAQQGLAETALQMYEQMCVEGIALNGHTLVSALQACGSLAEKETVDRQISYVQSLRKGKAIHAHARWMGYSTDNVVGDAVITMYGKCGSIVDAQNVFDNLSQRNVDSWTVLLAAYVHQRQAEKVLQLLEQMEGDSMSPDAWTFVSVLQAYGILADNEEGAMVNGISMKKRALEMAKVIHSEIRRKGYDIENFVGATLINVYGRCGDLVEARNVFEDLSCKKVVSWNVMLGAYVQHGQVDKALQLHERMEKEAVTLDEITVVYLLQLCSNMGSLAFLKQIHHSLISKKRDASCFLVNTLISAYGKCSSMFDAQNVFNTLVQRDVVSWTVLIAGYAREGNCAATLQKFDEMQRDGIKPDAVAFLSVLSACSHAGLVEKGAAYFDSMTRDHRIIPEIEHYVTMVDLFGRAGYFTRVEDLLSTMQMEPSMDLWLCLLGACRTHGKLALAEWAFECAVRMQPRDAAAYSMMTTMYADAGLWDAVERVKRLRQMEEAWKQAGQTWIEHGQMVQTFSVASCKGSLPGLCDLRDRVTSKVDEEGHIKGS